MSDIEISHLKMSLNYNFEANYILRRPNKVASSISILLHGFGFSGDHIYNKLISHLPDTTIILSPSAPLYAPILRKGSYRLGYSWYFWDEARQKYLLDDGISIDFVKKLFSELGLPSELPIQVIGFSQGGYLAPFIGQALPRCQQVIAIGGRFLYERIDPKQVNFALFGIHGEADETVDCKGAKESLEKFTAQGCSGDFFAYPDLKHEYHSEFCEKVGELSL